MKIALSSGSIILFEGWAAALSYGLVVGEDRRRLYETYGSYRLSVLVF